MEIRITDVAISDAGESKKQTLTVDITPKYNIIATTEAAVNGEDGIVSKGVENTIRNICRIGAEGMNGTDEEIIKIMTHCD